MAFWMGWRLTHCYDTPQKTICFASSLAVVLNTLTWHASVMNQTPFPLAMLLTTVAYLIRKYFKTNNKIQWTSRKDTANMRRDCHVTGAVMSYIQVANFLVRKLKTSVVFIKGGILERVVFMKKYIQDEHCLTPRFFCICSEATDNTCKHHIVTPCVHNTTSNQYNNRNINARSNQIWPVPQ